MGFALTSVQFGEPRFLWLLILPGALLFGFIDALNFQLQAKGVSIPSQYLSMMPYVFTLLVLTVVWTRQPCNEPSLEATGPSLSTVLLSRA